MTRALRVAVCSLALTAIFTGRSSAQETAAAPAADDASEQQAPRQQVIDYAVDQAHARQFADDPYPSAKKCAVCHPKHFREWSVSPHAYAQLSPVFNAMSNRLGELTSGTNGDFCIRCHTPIGMALDEPINGSNLDRHPASREGITCVVCHRINQAWGKGAGRQALVKGGTGVPVYGSIGDEYLQKVMADPDRYGVLGTSKIEARKEKPDENKLFHSRNERFFQLTTSGFCGACHDVFAPNGFRLEDAFSEFKASPAAREEGLNCQDCHMGKTPGKAEGYEGGPAAIVGNVPSPPREKLTNHMMAGPDYSIVHPGLFPHSLEAVREESANETDIGLATLREWLQFDDKAGWGTDRFEGSSPEASVFPAAWQDSIRRRKARRIIIDQKKLLREADVQRYQVLRAGYHLGEIERLGSAFGELKFRVPVSNITTGHGVPTGFDAERVVYLRTRVWNGNGRLIFQSGDLDRNGDLRDSHSVYVHNGEVPLDRQLFSLQTRFITRNVRGGEREQVLAIPYSLDPLPYVRPETRPFTVLGRPMAARKHKQNIEPRGKRWANYTVSRNRLRGPGPFTIRVQLITGMVPVNLIHEISSVGFDYGMSAKEVADAVVGGHMILYDRKATTN